MSSYQTWGILCAVGECRGGLIHFNSLPFLALHQVPASYLRVALVALLGAQTTCAHRASWAGRRNGEQGRCLALPPVALLPIVGTSRVFLELKYIINLCSEMNPSNCSGSRGHNENRLDQNEKKEPKGTE